MPNIFCVSASVDAAVTTFVVAVEPADPVVKFCSQWDATGRTAWVDIANDGDNLIEMWERLEQLPRIPFPCVVDTVIYAWYS